MTKKPHFKKFIFWTGKVDINKIINGPYIVLTGDNSYGQKLFKEEETCWECDFTYSVHGGPQPQKVTFKKVFKGSKESVNPLVRENKNY